MTREKIRRVRFATGLAVNVEMFSPSGQPFDGNRRDAKPVVRRPQYLISNGVQNGC